MVGGALSLPTNNPVTMTGEWFYWRISSIHISTAAVMQLLTMQLGFVWQIPWFFLANTLVVLALGCS